jgi:hypothetical protein
MSIFGSGGVHMISVSWFQVIRSECEDLSDDWPGREYVDKLVSSAHGLFIYATTVCCFRIQITILPIPRYRDLHNFDEFSAVFRGFLYHLALHSQLQTVKV